MRKLLTILFFIPVIGFGQMTITPSNTAFSTTGIGSIVSPTLTAGRLYILLVGVSNDLGAPATVSLAGTGQTWTLIDQIVSSSSRRIAAYRYAATSTTTSNINFSYTGTQDGAWCTLFEVVGAVMTGTNGSDAIVQAPTSNTGGPDPTITMSALLNRASVIIAFSNNANPFIGTVESGWTEAIDNGYATPDMGAYAMYRNNTSDNTPTVTASSTDWAGIAIEIKAAGRKNTNID